MITSIEIKNFLSHKDSRLELSPGVNVIVGATDSGKSVIIRALKWLITNRPRGESFRSNWGGDTEVKVSIGKYLVSRGKKGQNNYYSIIDSISFVPDKALESVYKAIGTEVPEEIQKVLNLNSINLQSQFESHFLLSKSPGEVATHFNKVAHLNTIDIGLGNIQTGINKLNNELNNCDIEASDLLESLDEYKDLDKFEKAVEQVEKAEKFIISIAISIDVLEDWIGEYTSVCHEIDDNTFNEDHIKLINEVVQMFKESRVLEGTSINLDFEIQIGNGIVAEIEAFEDVVSMEKQVDPLQQIFKEITNMTEEKFNLEKIVDRLKLENDIVKTTKRNLEGYEKEYHKVIGLGKTCPVCGNKIK